MEQLSGQPKRPQFTATNGKQVTQGGRIRLKLTDIMQAKGCVIQQGIGQGEVNVMRLARGTGLNYTTAKAIVRHPEEAKNISFETLARLCKFLGCQPGDLLEYVPAGVGPKAGISEAYKRDSISGWS